MKIISERKYTVTEVARILNCSKSQVRYLLVTGQLRGFKIKKSGSRGSWRIYESAIIDYLIENDNFAEFFSKKDFSELDEKVLLEKLKKKIFRLASRR